MGITPGYDFRENDVGLLQSGNFADGSIKCKGRTWNVHRALLASRLKFFKAAFYGSFAEATSGTVDFPEADPDSVDVMIRHLYGEALDVEDLKTPVLCVRCWKLGDYLQLASLQHLSISSLHDHLDAMALLASNDISMEDIQPKWLGHLFDAFREICADGGAEPLQTIPVTFLWVTRYKMLPLPQTVEVLSSFPDMNAELLKLLVQDELERPAWIPRIGYILTNIRCMNEITFKDVIHCSGCYKKVKANEGPRFYNPFPARRRRKGIGKLMWCKDCVAKFNRDRNWPWRHRRSSEEKREVNVEAWSWSENE